jgi:serine/threonine protein kinase
MAKALSHIHNKGIIHRDLKPANIFINNCYKVKIGDFGLAAEKKMTKDKVGTFLYQSPEQLENKPYNEKVDIYALGLILLEMCLVFNTETERRFTLINVRKGVYPDELKQMKNECELVMKMTRNQHNERPSIDDVINSKEIESIVERVNVCL